MCFINVLLFDLSVKACKITQLWMCLQEPVFENVDLGTIIVRVSATDADSGLFAAIEYSLVDGEGKFAIKPSTVSLFHTHTHSLHCTFSALGVSPEPHPRRTLTFKQTFFLCR